VADSIRGFAELGYVNLESQAKDSLGLKTETATDSFLQQYRLAMSKNLYPNLLLNAGGVFDTTKTTTDTGDLETRTTSTRSRPWTSR